MTLKWSAVVVAAVAVSLCVTANILVEALTVWQVPLVVNLFTIASAAVATVLAVLAEYQRRLEERLHTLSDYLVKQLNDIDNHTGDHNAGFVEGYMLGQAHDGTVIPLAPRVSGRRD
jgi:hypothetical protein